MGYKNEEGSLASLLTGEREAVNKGNRYTGGMGDDEWKREGEKTYYACAHFPSRKPAERAGGGGGTNGS